MEKIKNKDRLFVVESLVPMSVWFCWEFEQPRHAVPAGPFLASSFASETPRPPFFVFEKTNTETGYEKSQYLITGLYIIGCGLAARCRMFMKHEGGLGGPDICAVGLGS